MIKLKTTRLYKIFFLFFIISLSVVTFLPLTISQFDWHQPCFCKVGDAIESCPCDGKTIDAINNGKVYPSLQALLQREPFKFYKVNMEKPCPFWFDDSGQCSTKECTIGYCDNEVPEALRDLPRRPSNASSNEAITEPDCFSDGSSNKFDPLDSSLTDIDKAQLRDLDIFEANSNKFCAAEDENFDELHYVNLAKNPERYTGYKGNSALKVWKSIYSENCFKPDPKFDKNFLLRPTPTGMCLEKRVFYRLISGLHSAITVSIAANNFKPAPVGFGEGTWFRNTQMFTDRFGTKWSKEGPERLKNIYFTFMLELRALVKAGPYIQQSKIFYTGNENEDIETRQALEDLFGILKEFPEQFDETQLFSNLHESNARLLREEFRRHFWNISRIMDCVDCDKCRLWGKVQTHGMGIALKILFADLPRNGASTKTIEDKKMDNISIPFTLTRNDVVALFQSLGRYSSSIWEIEEFRKEYDEEWCLPNA
ncbi:hypothetical protein ACQ4LE_005559 [Meloidogyne hapla]|uniref:Endoplasmic oxidoreductin-1 n=1 Tax=Meloidogyne hapla TaxID=6305 RepID=A0A1I8BE63_MELHA